MLLFRNPSKLEVVSDTDGMLCNFYRSTQKAPVTVREYGTYPMFHQELSARRAWLRKWSSDNAARLSEDELFYDPQAAGYWWWCLRLWIGGGGNLLNKGDQVPNISFDLVPLDLQLIRRRLQNVQIINRDWTACVARVEHHTKWREQDVAFVVDPPYRLVGQDGTKRSTLYSLESDRPAIDSYNWCVANGDKYRIVYFCAEGDFPVPDGWDFTSRAFKSSRNDDLEVAMYSPRCLARSSQMRMI